MSLLEKKGILTRDEIIEEIKSLRAKAEILLKKLVYGGQAGVDRAAF